MFLRPPRLLRAVRSLAALAGAAFLFLLVPKGFAACSATRGALGTAAEMGAVGSALDSAVAEESTSPRIVGPWRAGLSLFHCGRDRGGNSARAMVSGLGETRRA
jgi:hypothetical protein